MQKKGTVVLNAYIAYPGLANLANRLKDEFQKFSVDIQIINNSEILAFLEGNGNFSDLSLKTDFVVYLDKDPYIAEILEKKGLRLFNKAESIRRCDDKMLTYLTLANNGIAMPKTITAPLCYANKDNDAFVLNLEKTLQFPMISKLNFGSQGKGVALVRNHEELIKREKEIAYFPRLYQEQIASSFGVDYRLIVIGGKCFASMKRENHSGDFRSNIALGGRGESVELPSSFYKLAEKAAKLLNLDYCGVDLLMGENNSPILCEVNSNAFIDGIEKATNKNVAGAYANHIIKTIY